MTNEKWTWRNGGTYLAKSTFTDAPEEKKVEEVGIAIEIDRLEC